VTVARSTPIRWIFERDPRVAGLEEGRQQPAPEVNGTNPLGQQFILDEIILHVKIHFIILLHMRHNDSE
jgi:hypothetical protein